MAKIVKQFRYYGKGNSNNTNNTDISSLSKGKVFFDDVDAQSIVQLGIQTIPGTKFYLNDGVEPILVGTTGIYELDISGLADITSLKFDYTSLTNIQDLDGAYLIVDAIYETEEE